jgi:arylformamidase
MLEKEWIDISQPLTNDIAVFPGDKPYQFHLSYTKEETGSVNIGHISTGVHTGTHVDAPFHFQQEGNTIEMLDIHVFMGKARLIDVSAYGTITISLLEKFHLQDTNRLLFKTDNQRNPKVFPKQFTVIDPEVGPYLKEKGIFLIGTDAPSVDPETSKSVRAHHALGENGIYILENLMLNDIEVGDYELIALPLRIVGADGSPVRAVIRAI